MIETPRLKLHEWSDRHRAAFADMHSHPEVMADLGGPISRAESDLKFDLYCAALRDHGTSRWAVEDNDGRFLGYAGVMPRMSKEHPLGPHFEVGWRFVRPAWGNGFVTESARAALDHARRNVGLTGILSYTSTENRRSQAVMKRLDFIRQPSFDFIIPASHHGTEWHALVWAVPDITVANVG